MFKTFNEVFAIIDFDVFKDEEIPKNILKKFEKRNKAKSEGDFAKADKIREEILSLGYRIVDDRGGSYLDGRGYAFE
jgi:cysteinyl-tRNA synthetase